MTAPWPGTAGFHSIRRCVVARGRSDGSLCTGCDSSGAATRSSHRIAGAGATGARIPGPIAAGIPLCTVRLYDEPTMSSPVHLRQLDGVKRRLETCCSLAARKSR